MVMAVDAGHKMQKSKVAWYMFATIIGGLIFVGSQAWEWNTFINGSYGAVKTTNGKVLQFVKDGKQIALSDFVVGNRMDERVTHTKKNGLWFVSGEEVPKYSLAQITASYKADPSVQKRNIFYLEKKVWLSWQTGKGLLKVLIYQQMNMEIQFLQISFSLSQVFTGFTCFLELY
jgi:cytochrome c oxidase subunit 3